MEDQVEGAELKEQVGNELLFTLPRHDVSRLAQFFATLDNQKRRLNVLAYGISDTTLEEVGFWLTIWLLGNRFAEECSRVRHEWQQEREPALQKNRRQILFNNCDKL